MTVVEELIEHIKTLAEINDPLRNDIEANIQIWLIKEKKQIVDAYNADLYGGLSGQRKFNDGDDYYNDTFGDSV